MTTVVNLASRRIRAGAPAHSDERSQCRLSHDVTAEYMQIGAHRMQCLDAQHEPDSLLEDIAPVLLAAAFTIAAFVGVMFLVTR